MNLAAKSCEICRQFAYHGGSNVILKLSPATSNKVRAMKHTTASILATLLVLLLAAAALAAPFVPARDPQVVAFSPSGAVVATGCSGMSDGSFPPRPHPDVRKCAVVAIWDVGTGKRLARMETYGDFTQLAFNADGTLLAAARLFTTADGIPMHEVRVWDATTGRVVKVLDRCHAFDFSLDGGQLVVVSRSKCVVYDRRDWTKEHQIKPLGGCVSVAFLLDGESILGVVRKQADGKSSACPSPEQQGGLIPRSKDPNSPRRHCRSEPLFVIAWRRPT